MEEQHHLVLTSHPPKGAAKPLDINWGANSIPERGPIIGSLLAPEQRNVIGVHSGAYGVYRALSVAAGQLDPIHKPDLTNTSPATEIGPFPQWRSPKKIVSLDPWGHLVSQSFDKELKKGYDIRPTIAVTKARISFPEIRESIAGKRLQPDGAVLHKNGDVSVTKVAIEPVWYLPGMAERLDVTEADLRRTLFTQSGNMYPELVTRSDLKVFLPPIGGITLYIFGDQTALWDRSDREISCRVHDECNGSDVFGSDICTCRPYLVHGVEECVMSSQKGGAGLIVYNRKEGRALGEVIKFLVYNARKRNPDGDTAAGYFERTECIAGVKDMRFQDLMPDVFHWLGITKIHRWISMSDMKFDAMDKQGIKIMQRIPIPDHMIPADAQVEMDAKKAAGYYVDGPAGRLNDLHLPKGRGLGQF